MLHFSTWGLPGQSLLQGLIINRWYETLWSPEAVLNVLIMIWDTHVRWMSHVNKTETEKRKKHDSKQ